MAVWDKVDYATVDAWKDKENMMKQLKKGVPWVSMRTRNKVNVTDAGPKSINTTFQQSLKATLIIGQLFSLIPVTDITNEDPARVRFVSRSWKVVYTWLSFIGQLFMVIMCVFKLFSSDTSLKATKLEVIGIQMARRLQLTSSAGLSLSGAEMSIQCTMVLHHRNQYKATNPSALYGSIPMQWTLTLTLSLPPTSIVLFSTIIFYATTCITMYMFFQMAHDWSKLIDIVTKNEGMDPSCDGRLAKRCNITCAAVLLLALFEHILSLISAFAGSGHCYPSKPLYEGFVRHFYPWVFDFLPYSMVLGLITQFLHFQSTFVWNFSDLFVISLSYYLTSRLNQVNKKLQAAQGKYLPEPFWRTTREEYCRVTQLIRKVDDVISGIIFMSFANNLFFICFQLFNTLEHGFKGRVQCSPQSTEAGPLKGYEAAAYFFFSLVYLISRSVAVSLIAAEVNTASMVPAPVLYDVPSPVYCIEVQRFLDQVNGDIVALSGLRFFSITRGLLLTVAGTIVTYELVMVQFNTSPVSHPTSVATTTDPTLFDNITTTTV